MEILNKREIIKELWEKGLGITEISKKSNIPTGNVSYYLDKIYGKTREKRHIYKMRLYSIDENFFKEINTEAKAYFFGLLSADGNLCKTQNLVRINLHEKDKEILETFRKHLKYTKPLKLIEKSTKDWNRSNQYLLDISCSEIRKDLEKHGLTPNKSLTLVFPKTITEKFIHHYLRGYFDGDGCVSIGKNNIAEISIAGSEIFCKAIVTLLKKKDISSKLSKHSTANCYYTRVKGSNNILKFYNFLYENSTVFLNRKKEKFDNWLIKKQIKL